MEPLHLLPCKQALLYPIRHLQLGQQDYVYRL